MRRPDAPFVEFGFYFADMDGNAAIRKVYLELLRREWTCGEKVVLQRGPSVRKGVAFIGDEEPMAITRIHGDAELQQLLTLDNTRVVNIEMRSAVPIVPNRYAILAQGMVCPEVANKDRNPIELRFQGSDLDRPHSAFSAKSRKLVAKFFQAFRDMAVLLDPTYATISIESSMPCPAELRLNDFTSAFLDSYLSEALVGAHELRSLAAKAEPAHVERIDGGMLFMSSGFFLPNGPDETIMRSGNSQCSSMICTAILNAISAQARRPLRKNGEGS